MEIPINQKPLGLVLSPKSFSALLISLPLHHLICPLGLGCIFSTGVFTERVVRTQTGMTPLEDAISCDVTSLFTHLLSRGKLCVLKNCWARQIAWEWLRGRKWGNQAVAGQRNRLNNPITRYSNIVFPPDRWK